MEPPGGSPNISTTEGHDRCPATTYLSQATDTRISPEGGVGAPLATLTCRGEKGSLEQIPGWVHLVLDTCLNTTQSPSSPGDRLRTRVGPWVLVDQVDWELCSVSVSCWPSLTLDMPGTFWGTGLTQGPCLSQGQACGVLGREPLGECGCVHTAPIRPVSRLNSCLTVCQHSSPAFQ